MAADTNDTTADSLAAGASVFGLVSLAVCWWFPFGPAVGTLGTGCGALGWWGGADGRRALTGLALSACGAGAGFLLAWDYWRRLLLS